METHITLTHTQVQMLEPERTLGIISVNSRFIDLETEAIKGLSPCSQMLPMDIAGKHLKVLEKRLEM